MSGRRGSNPRPQPWQGCALPTELLPLIIAITKATAINYLNVCKDLIFPLPQAAYRFRFATFVIGTAKIGGCIFPTKFFLLKNHLFILRSIQSISGHIHLGLTLVMMRIQTIAATDYQGYDTKYLQVK